MACAGRASPGVVREILKHYGTDAARHRTKEGYLPFHLVALHGCSSEEVPIMLLRKYPDAAMGRNRFDWIPLEEALFAAGGKWKTFYSWMGGARSGSETKIGWTMVLFIVALRA